MRTLVIGTFGLALAALLGLTALRADEVKEGKVPLDKLPKAVTDAVKAKFEGCELVGASKEKEDGKEVFEVVIKHKGHSMEVTLTPEGKLVSVEKEIAAKDLPKAVSEALDAKYPKATIKKVEEETKGDKVTYEVLLVTAAKKKLEVVFDPKGKIAGGREEGRQEGQVSGGRPGPLRVPATMGRFIRGDVMPMRAVAAVSRTCLVVCCIGLSLCLGCQRAAPPGAEKAPPAVVKWEAPLLSSLEEWTELVGTTMPVPDHAARVSAAVEGRVMSVFGDAGGKPIVEGQRVEKGTVLAQLDTSITQANLAKAEAARDVLREEERQAQLAMELASSEAQRLKKLKDEDNARPSGSGTPLVSAVDVYKAGMALKDAESKLKGAEAKLVAGAREEDALRAQLKLLTLTAPISGRIGRVQVVPGQTLAVGATVAEIVDLDDQIDVLCFVPPSLLKRLQLGQLVVSGPLDHPEATGQVEYIAEQAEPETGNFAVKVRFDNKSAHLRSNRVLRLNVKTQEGKECLSLPEAAVSEDQEVPTVVIVESKVEKNEKNEDETVYYARRLQVTLGVRDRLLRQVEIVSLEDPDKEAKVKWQGEAKDQQFVVEGGLGLQTGDKVRLDAGDD